MSYPDDISSEEAYILLRTVGGEIDRDLSAGLSVINPRPVPELVFQLNDGRVMLVSPVRPEFDPTIKIFDPTIKMYWAREEGMMSMVIVYPSRADFEDWMNADPAGEVPGIYDAVQPYGENFPEHVAELCRLLPERLGLPQDALDGTLWTLHLLDNALAQLERDYSRPYPELDPAISGPMIAYVGEIIRKAYQGKWVVKMGRDPRSGDDEYNAAEYIWIPRIEAKNYRRGKSQNLFSAIGYALIEDESHVIGYAVRDHVWEILTPEEKQRSSILIGLPENYGENGFE